MQISQAEVKDLQTVLTMVVEPKDYQENVEKELRKLRQKANMPGFRPGMVPFALVKKMYGKGVMAEVINKEIGVQLGKYIEEQKLDVLGDPLPNEELTPQVDFDTQDTFTFAFDVALAPEFDAKLTGKNHLTYYKVDVTDEMVSNQINSYASRFGEYAEADDVTETDVVRGVIKELKEGGIEKDNAILNPQYMRDEEQKKLFIGAKKDDIITFNPVKAFASEVETGSLLDIKKDEVKDHEGDFTFQITGITRHVNAKIDGELFAKVYGDNNIKDEADFREHVRAEIQENMDEDSEYKFGLDVKAAIMKKMESTVMPEAFLRRWVKATNEKMTDEELDRDFPKMIDELKWHLAKNQLLKHYDINVDKDDVEAYAMKVAKMQFMQYGLMHVDEQYLKNFAQDMLKKDDQVRGMVERVTEEKIYAAVKKTVKMEEKTVSHEEFGKLFA